MPLGLLTGPVVVVVSLTGQFDAGQFKVAPAFKRSSIDAAMSVRRVESRVVSARVSRLKVPVKRVDVFNAAIDPYDLIAISLDRLLEINSSIKPMRESEILLRREENVWSAVNSAREVGNEREWNIFRQHLCAEFDPSQRRGRLAEVFNLNTHRCPARVFEFDAGRIVRHFDVRAQLRSSGVSSFENQSSRSAPQESCKDSEAKGNQSQGNSGAREPPIERRFFVMLVMLVSGLCFAFRGGECFYDKRRLLSAAYVWSGVLLCFGGLGVWFLNVFPRTWGWLL